MVLGEVTLIHKGKQEVDAFSTEGAGLSVDYSIHGRRGGRGAQGKALQFLASRAVQVRVRSRQAPGAGHSALWGGWGRG